MARNRSTSQASAPRDSEWLVNQIAHALRNPIFAAQVQAEALVIRAGEDQKVANAAGLIHRQLKRLEADINEMLLYGRPPKLNPRRVKLSQPVAQVAARFRRGENGDPADITVTAPADEPEITIDPDAVNIILERLIVNAIQHTPDPHRVQVELTVQAGVGLRLSVRDEGEGVSDAVSEMIFLPFYPQHSGRPGLGLSVAAKFAHAMGGSIAIESEEGCGTTASLTLPLT